MTNRILKTGIVIGLPFLAGVVGTCAFNRNSEIQSNNLENKIVNYEEVHSEKNVEISYDEKTEELGNSFLVEMISRHEGRRNCVYDDATGKRLYSGDKSQGNRTIAVGFNLERADARKKIESIGLNFESVYSGKDCLSEEQINYFLEEDIEIASDDAKKYLGVENFESLPKLARDVLIDMSFNLGYNRLSKFKKLKSALIGKDYAEASAEMKDSKWYHQVGNRSKELVNYMNSLAEN
jgi:GH24 family phage-related lysozyme (muramidase)|tara:strand:+ start:921 stop:1631 length:711 start_codon:yes stop_codon:yes gene_type:complete